MKLATRKKIFYLLLAAFIVLLPIVIAHSLGYTINLSSRSLEQRGGIFIKSTIASISIFLDNEFQKETSIFSGGALLTEIRPGIHLLRLEKENYRPWSKTVTVEKAAVTEIRNVILIPSPVMTATATRDEIISLGLATTTSARKIRLDKKNNLVEDRVLNGRATTTVLTPGVNSFAYIDGAIFFITEAGFAAKLNSNGMIETLGRPGFFLSDKIPAQFFISPRSELAILDAGGGLFIIESETNELKPLAGGAKAISFDTEGEKLILKKENSIEILWLQDNEYQPFQKKGLIEQIITLQEPILDARWYYYDDAHIVMLTKDGVYFTEIDGRGGRNTGELISERIDELVTAADYPRSIYLRRNKLWKKIEL
ncbi:MAG: PEGA domain-containing protein [Candidatus Sungbacteria bacterium]|nr:PEGA domain-containing protein [Candidatus Sungbacteria bacterium]